MARKTWATSPWKHLNADLLSFSIAIILEKLCFSVFVFRFSSCIINKFMEQRQEKS